MLNNAFNFIQETRNSYRENVLNIAKSLCSRRRIPNKFVGQKESYDRKNLYDNLNWNRKHNTTEKTFKVKIFLIVLDFNSKYS